MNILLTRECNRNCPYCFAKERMSSRGNPTALNVAPLAISKADFSRAIEFAKNSGEERVGVLGGEPSLHPEFFDLLTIALEAGLRTTVFTNALWKDEQIEHVAALRDKYDARLHFFVNMNEPARSPNGEHQRQSRLFKAVPRSCSLSFNLSRADCDARFLVEVINTYGITRDIRLGLAQPLADMPNEHVSIADYKDMAPSILALAQECDKCNIRFGFDCGFVLCMFTEEQVGKLVLAGAHFTSFCGPAIDVGTDLSVWACFPLSTFATGEKLDAFRDLAELKKHFRVQFDQLFAHGALEQCAECRYQLRKQCTGGCAAQVYRSRNSHKMTRISD